MNWTEWAANIAFLGVPPVSCMWGWWLWSHDGEANLAEWRRKASTIGLVTLTLSVLTGAFAMMYWRHFPGAVPVPQPTRIATLAGFALVVFAAPFAVLARAWMRVALVMCSIALLGFYFGMFLAP